MLKELYIENFLLIKKIRLILGPGINVFTGETGAGKSMLIDALGLIRGERSRSDLVRPGEAKLLVEVVFDWPAAEEAKRLLEEIGMENEDDNLIVSREISAAGKSTARINGRVVPLSFLRAITPYLLDIHAQGDTQTLEETENNNRWLDMYDPVLAVLTGKMRRAYEKSRELEEELAAKQRQRGELLRERDYLDFQIEEITRAGLYPGEEEELAERFRLMKSAADLIEVCQAVKDILYTGKEGLSAYDQIMASCRLLRRFEREPEISSLLEPLNEVAYSLEEIQSSLGNLILRLQFEPGEMEAVEERLHLLNRLFRKYGSSSQEVLSFLAELQKRRAELDGLETSEEELASALEKAKEEYERLSQEVSKRRQEVALLIEDAVQKELGLLAMPHARFKVDLEPLPSPSPQGKERAVFLFSDNPGQEMKPLNRIASGGELSRLALAFKVVFASIFPVETYVFDEIDAGMSGHALGQIAGRIAALAVSRQVIIITHAPAVAAYGDRHFLIRKMTSGDTTVTEVTELTHEQKVEELAHMMTDETPLASARQLAQELIATASDVKSSLRQG